jgi:hypothetical protein
MKTTQILVGFSLMLLMVGVACKASKEAVWTPVGSWDFVVKNTPEGDVNGVLVLTQNGDGYSATMSTPDGAIDLDDVEVADKKFTAVLNYQGYQLDVEGTFAGESLNGTVAMGYDSFTLTASRK